MVFQVYKHNLQEPAPIISRLVRWLNPHLQEFIFRAVLFVSSILHSLLSQLLSHQCFDSLNYLCMSKQRKCYINYTVHTSVSQRARLFSSDVQRCVACCFSSVVYHHNQNRIKEAWRSELLLDSAALFFKANKLYHWFALKFQGFWSCSSM